MVVFPVSVVPELWPDRAGEKSHKHLLEFLERLGPEDVEKLVRNPKVQSGTVGPDQALLLPPGYLTYERTGQKCKCNVLM